MAATAIGIGLGPAAMVHAQEVTPLTLTPQNTVILSGHRYGAAHLRYYLVKFLVGAEHVEGDYKLKASADGLFPLLRAKDTVPAGKNVLAVGRTSFLTDDDRQWLEANPSSMLIARRDHVVVIAGSPLGEGWHGTYKAMGKALDMIWGIRFYAPGDLWTSRPSLPEVQIEQLDFRFTCPFLKGSLSPRPSTREWTNMNPLPNLSGLRATHALAYLLNPEQIGVHPEIYPVHNGRRDTPGGLSWNPCLSAPSLVDLTMQVIRKRVADRKQQHRPMPDYISLGVMDMPFTCECPACQASLARHDSFSNLYYEYVNAVARRVAREFPGMYITTYVYSNVRTPPVGMRIEPNVVVDLVTKSYRFVDPEWRDYEKDRAAAFARLGAKWVIHDWAFASITPRLYMRQYAGFFQWAARHGMIGGLAETSPEENWYLEGAQYWIFAQLWWNPWQDVDLLWKQYCDDLYGPASQLMYDFWAHFHNRYVYAPDQIEISMLPQEDLALYSPEDLAWQRAQLQKAVAVTKGDAAIQQRLEKVLRYFRGHELFAQAVGEIYRLSRAHEGDGLNKAALAYYLNEKGNKLGEAIDYYYNRRTLPPDVNEGNRRQGEPFGHISMYTQAMQQILGVIRSQAMAGVDASDPRAAADRIVERSLEVFRDHLPPTRDPARVRQWESILRKTLVIPRVDKMPTLDGELSEAVWQKAARLEDFSERDTLADKPHAIAGRVMRVGDHLVFGFDLRMQGPLWVSTAPDVQTGSLSWRESGLEFFYGEAAASEKAEPVVAQYIINYLGAFQGYLAAANNRQGVTVRTTYDPDQGTCVVEAAFPLKLEDKHDFTAAKALSFNVMFKTTPPDTKYPKDVMGWYPIFLSPHRPESRAIVFME